MPFDIADLASRAAGFVASRCSLFKVVKFTTNVTAQKQEYADLSGQVTAINSAMAVIEFSLDGTITRANDNFLNAMGYRLVEIVGRHHKMFVEPSYADSTNYNDFWATLRQGKHQAAQQSVVTQGMSASMQETAGGVAAINDNMVKISSAVQQVGQAVNNTRTAAQVLVR